MISAKQRVNERKQAHAYCLHRAQNLGENNVSMQVYERKNNNEIHALEMNFEVFFNDSNTVYHLLLIVGKEYFFHWSQHI